jgi:hypothetical protein
VGIKRKLNKMAGLPNLNPYNKLALKCDDGTTFKSLIFGVDNNASNLEVVKGADTLAGFSLASFFVPIDKFQTQDFTIKAGQSLIVSGCNMESPSGEVQFIGILVTYPDFDSDQNAVTTEDKSIKYEYPIGGAQYNLGKIMLLSGTTKAGSGWTLTDGSPGGLKLINQHDKIDVEVKVLICN